ncbi:hypothetical protein PAXINDRAFT_157642 [Paxillus involutus ATCC 200175]|uniref:Uncharacterized protein n=1 Tax=Paxillus involutus ATCC 200175 TaxID=664439 RepID=A0A0C9SRE2_PAXIN|nr:hypothetical protein PAXINDRAFT_157642 [Paxillus involutus ATCC 200175]
MAEDMGTEGWEQGDGGWGIGRWEDGGTHKYTKTQGHVDPGACDTGTHEHRNMGIQGQGIGAEKSRKMGDGRQETGDRRTGIQDMRIWGYGNRRMGGWGTGDRK